MLERQLDTPDVANEDRGARRSPWSRLWNRRRPAPSVPEGLRLYAIGDIHGCIDPLDALLERIAEDSAGHAAEQTRLIFLGDYIDRGPASREVIDRLIAIRDEGEAIMLCGNHEDMLVSLYTGDRSYASSFHRSGGRATLLSYGVDPDDYDGWTLDELTEQVSRVIPRAHIDFLASLPEQHRCGGYFFAHAGIRPGVPLDRQRRADLLWIRDGFSDSSEIHEAMIVHGHAIVDSIEERVNRIAVDTGAYRSGKLSALVLEGETRRHLSS